MGKSDTNNTTALAQAFGVIGNGSAEIAWVEHYTQGACTVKLGQNRWGVVLPLLRILWPGRDRLLLETGLLSRPTRTTACLNRRRSRYTRCGVNPS